MTASSAATQISVGYVTGCIAGGRSGWNDARDLLAREMIHVSAAAAVPSG